MKSKNTHTDEEIAIAEYAASIIEYATQAIIGDRQEITEEEMKVVVYMVAQILTDKARD